MPDQNILFNLEGDASNAIDALKTLLEALTGVNEALATLTGGVSALNDLVNAIGNLAGSSVNVTDLKDALAELPIEEIAAADGAKVLSDSLAQLPVAADDLIGSVSAVTSTLTTLDTTLSDEASTFAAVIPSISDLISLFDTLDGTGIGVDAALTLIDETLAGMGVPAYAAMELILQVMDALGMLQPVAQIAGEALDILSVAEVDLTAGLTPYVTAVGDATALTTSFGDIINLTAQQLSVYVDALGRGIPEADAFAQATGTLQVAMADLATGSVADEEALALLFEAFTPLSAAVSEITPNIQAVLDTLITMSAAGMDAVAFFDALDQACFNASVSLDDILTPLDALMTSLGMIAPAVADFSTSFTDAQLQVGLFGQTLSSIPAEVDAAAAAFGTMTAAERDAAAAADEKNVAMREQTSVTQGDGFMALMLVQYMVQLASAFIKMGTSAQDAIAHLSGLADQSLAGAAGASKLSGVIQQLEQDSIKFGTNLTAAAQGLYFIMSAGFNTADSLLILKSSMEASSATGATMTSISSGLTSILNAYGLTAKSAAMITNQMVQSIVSGKMPAQDYSNAIGNLAAVAHQTGFSFVEATSSLAEFTQINGRTRQDAQNLAATFVVLGTESGKIATAAKGLGISFDETAFKSMDLTEKLNYLSKIAGGDNTTAFRALLLNTTAARTAFELLANGGKNLATVMGQVNNSQQALNIAFSESEKTVTAAVNHMQAALSVLAYQLTVLATPLVQAALGALTTALTFLSQHMEILIPIVTALAVLFGGLLIGALISVVGMLGSLVSMVVTVVGPIALVAAGIAFLVVAFQNLTPSIYGVMGLMGVTRVYISELAGMIGGIFNSAVRQAGVLFQQLGAWAQANVIPALQQITINLLALVNGGLYSAITGFDGFMNSLRPIGAFLMSSVIPAIGDLIKGFLQIAVVISANIVPILQTLRSILVIAVGAVAGFGAAWGLIQIQMLAMFLPALTTIIGEFVAGLIPALLTAATAAFTAAAAFIALNLPFILIGAAIALAVIGFIALWNASAPVRAVFAAVGMEALKLWNVLAASLGPVLQQLWATIQTQLVPAWNQLVAALQPLMPTLMALGAVLGGVIVTVLGIVISLIAGLIAGLARFLMGIIQTVGGIIQVFSGIVSVISGFLQLIVGLFTGNEANIQAGWGRMGQGIQTIWSGLGNILVGLIMATFGTIISFVVTFAQTFIQFFVNIWHALVGGSIWPDMLNAMLSLLTSWISNVTSAITSFVSNVISFFGAFGTQVQSLFQAMWVTVSTIFTTALAAVHALLSGNFALFLQLFHQLALEMYQAMVTAWNNIVNAVRAGVANVLSVINGWINTLKGIFANLASMAFHWGLDFMAQMAAGVGAAAGGVIAAAQGVAAKVAGLLHFSVPDEGPLADADKWMPDFGDLLASGLNEQVNKVGKAASNMAMSVQMATPSPNDIARYSAPATPTTTTDDTVAVLKLILAELQSQRQSGGGRMAIGHTLPSTALGTTSQTFGGGGTGINAAHQQYQQMNVLAGIAYENSVRGAITGLGV